MTASLPRTSKATAAAGSTRTDDVRRIAARLFEVSGYSATTMHDIAEAAGVLPGSLYHHFGAKEDIAVDLLLAFAAALGQVRSPGNVRPEEAEDAVRRLTGQVTELGYEHAAAVRLLVHEAPPSVSTERFTAAMHLRAPALDRAWRDAIRPFGRLDPAPGADLSLLRYALGRTAFFASAQYPADVDPGDLADHLCDLMLHGLVTDCPDDADLDRSAALAAATEVVTEWARDAHDEPSGPREQIVAAARSEFARRGYEATTIRDIANAADISMGTLYRRIESKEALLLELLEEYSQRMGRAFNAVLTAGSTEPEMLDGLARVFVNASRRYREESQIVNYGWTQREAPSSPFHGYYVATEQRLALLTSVMRSGFDGGRLRPVTDPRETWFHVRMLLWLPFHEHARTSEARAHRFLRRSLLRGALKPA